MNGRDAKMMWRPGWLVFRWPGAGFLTALGFVAVTNVEIAQRRLQLLLQLLPELLELLLLLLLAFLYGRCYLVFLAR
jgi:hypothetical protein